MARLISCNASACRQNRLAAATAAIFGSKRDRLRLAVNATAGWLAQKARFELARVTIAATVRGQRPLPLCTERERERAR